MRKKTVTLTIDEDIWLAFQTQVDDRNRSSTITNLLRHYLVINTTDKNEEEIRERIETLNKKREDIMQECSSLSVELSVIQNNVKKKQVLAEKFSDMVTNSQVRSKWEDVDNG